LQQAVDHALEGRAGSIAVVDVSSDKILASKNLDLAATELVRPGSTLKPFVLMELLAAGKLDPNQHLTCRRPLRIGAMRLDCAHTPAVTRLNTDDAIAYSCNSYVAEAVLRATGPELAEALRRAGFDSVRDEALGHIETPSTQVQIQLLALGQQGIEVTPLELLEAFRKLALRRQGSNNSSGAAIFDGLEHSVTYGMAHAAYVDGLKVAGKTGTATETNNPRTHGLFVGYAPAEQPRIALVVYLRNGRGLDGAMLAGTIFAEFARTSEKH